MNKYINNLINSAGIVLIFVSLIGAMQSRILWLDKLSNGLIVTITISLILLFYLLHLRKRVYFRKFFLLSDCTKNGYFGFFYILYNISNSISNNTKWNT